MKKLTNLFTYRNLALLLCISAAVNLIWPIYSAADELEEVFVVTVKLINLPEFSGWGGIVAVLPLLLAAVLCSNLNTTVRIVSWFVLNLTGAYALPAAMLAARTYLTSHVGPFITRHSGLSLFLPLLIAASVVTLIALNEECGYAHTETDEEQIDQTALP